jgi:hypothetical protein
MPRPRCSLLLAYLALSGRPTVAHSQYCFRGRPAPHCQSFMLLEFAPTVRLNAKAPPTDGAPLVTTWTIGTLWNVGARSAFGGVASLTADGDGHRVILGVRYRRWLAKLRSVDLSAGYVVAAKKDDFGRPKLRSPSMAAELALQSGDRIGLVLGLERLRRTDGALSWESHAGLRFGTWLAPLATVGLLLVAAASYR